MTELSAKLRVAIVHDSLIQYGGAERVVETLDEMFPDAPIFTLVYDKEKYPGNVAGWDIRVSFLQRVYNLHKNFKHLLSLLPFANKAFNFSGYDVVISSSSLFLKGLDVPKGVVHIAYCHTPPRFLWTETIYIDQEVPWLLRPLVRGMVPWLKGADKEFARRPTVLLANSKEVQKRIKQFYERDAEVVYPFVDMEFWKPLDSQLRGDPNASEGRRGNLSEDQIASSDALLAISEVKKQGYFLIGGRLQAHKDNDSIINLFNELGLPLHVVGTGTQVEHLKSRAAENIMFLGRVSDEQLREEYSGARGFIYPQFEDLGLMPLEAAACGTASIGLDHGGTLETVIPGKTGELFDGSIEKLRELILTWDETKYSHADLKQHAEKFSKEVFKKSIMERIEKYLN